MQPLPFYIITQEARIYYRKISKNIEKKKTLPRHTIIHVHVHARTQAQGLFFKPQVELFAVF